MRRINFKDNFKTESARNVRIVRKILKEHSSIRSINTIGDEDESEQEGSLRECDSDSD